MSNKARHLGWHVEGIVEGQSNYTSDCTGCCSVLRIDALAVLFGRTSCATSPKILACIVRFDVRTLGVHSRNVPSSLNASQSEAEACANLVPVTLP